jgi:hypothetical protein
MAMSEAVEMVVAGLKEVLLRFEKCNGAKW